MIDQARLIVVALIISGAYSLTIGNNLLVGIIAQISWMVTQTDFCHCMGLREVRNLLIQFLFLVILLGEIKDQCKKCCMAKKAKAN